MLQASEKRTEEFCSRLGFDQENLPVLYLNIRYEDSTLYCVTGLSLKIFTLDKTIEQEWDRQGEVLLKKWELHVRDSKGFNFSQEEAVSPLTGGERTEGSWRKRC